MATTAGRRPLKFASLDEILPDVDRLRCRGYTSVGKWSLGQVCEHLAIGVNGSIDGTGASAPWIVRKLLAPIFMRKMRRTQSMPEGIKVPKEILPGPVVADEAGIEALRAALSRYSAMTEPPREHPFFGRMTRAQWDELHRIHCAHHLSFLTPKG